MQEMANGEAQMAPARRGGKRVGAGRKKRDVALWMEARGMHPATAAEILAAADERKLWYRILHSEDDRVLLSAMQFLVQMRDGKPAQSINVTSTNINLQSKDLQAARDIIREIRGEQANSSELNSLNQNDLPMLSGGEGGNLGGR